MPRSKSAQPLNGPEVSASERDAARTPEVPSTPSPPSDTRRLFDISSAAVYLQSIGATTASKKFVYSLMASGEVPRVRIGKAYYVSKIALDNWLVRHERRAR
jgi:hypothetical protein